MEIDEQRIRKLVNKEINKLMNIMIIPNLNRRLHRTIPLDIKRDKNMR
jgi:hypothetical protein